MKILLISRYHGRLDGKEHNDAGGDAVMFDKIQKAYDLATGKAK